MPARARVTDASAAGMYTRYLSERVVSIAGESEPNKLDGWRTRAQVQLLVGRESRQLQR